MKTIKKTHSILAATAIGIALLAGPGAAANAAPVATGIFNPDACVIKLGWNNTFRYINGVKMQRFGAYTGPSSCPREEWRKPGQNGSGWV